MITYRGYVTQQLFIRSLWMHMKSRSLILLAFPGVFIALLAVGWNGSRDASLATNLVAVAIAFLWPPLMLAFLFWQWIRTYKRSPYLKQPLWGRVSEAGVEFHGPNGERTVPWNLFVRQRQGKDLMLLYQSPVLFNLLAREFFASEQAWAEACALVQTRVANGRAS